VKISSSAKRIFMRFLMRYKEETLLSLTLFLIDFCDKFFSFLSLNTSKKITRRCRKFLYFENMKVSDIVKNFFHLTESFTKNLISFYPFLFPYQEVLLPYQVGFSSPLFLILLIIFLLLLGKYGASSTSPLP
jgi:hypothetical protein